MDRPVPIPGSYWRTRTKEEYTGNNYRYEGNNKVVQVLRLGQYYKWTNYRKVFYKIVSYNSPTRRPPKGCERYCALEYFLSEYIPMEYEHLQNSVQTTT